MPSVLSHFFSQSFFLPNPPLTENNLPNQSGRVFIITGGYAGVGFELCKILFSKNAVIYLAGRSADKANSAIARIRKDSSESDGRLEFLELDLSDLATVRPAVDHFLRKEARLDVLVNNAGVMFPPIGSLSTQGYELQIATNCLGHYLFTKLLLPILDRTAMLSPSRSVRVLWAASFGVDALSPPKGISLNTEGSFQAHLSNTQTNYGASKVGNYFLASQFAHHHPIPSSGNGVVHLAFNPGNLRTELQRHSSAWRVWIIDKLLLYPAKFGAYTELWAGWAQDINNESHGGYVWPWGRLGSVREDVQAELKQGGNAEKFCEWCESATKSF